MVYKEAPELDRIRKVVKKKELKEPKTRPYFTSTSHFEGGLIRFEKGYLKNNIRGFGNVFVCMITNNIV